MTERITRTRRRKKKEQVQWHERAFVVANLLRELIGLVVLLRSVKDPEPSALFLTVRRAVDDAEKRSVRSDFNPVTDEMFDPPQIKGLNDA